MTRDPELLRLHRQAMRANAELIRRLESHGELVPSRADEAAILDDVARLALQIERSLRDSYEQARNLREMFEDPDLRPPPKPEPPESDPRSGT
jgi:hypothetical protein